MRFHPMPSFNHFVLCRTMLHGTMLKIAWETSEHNAFHSDDAAALLSFLHDGVSWSGLTLSGRIDHSLRLGTVDAPESLVKDLTMAVSSGTPQARGSTCALRSEAASCTCGTMRGRRIVVLLRSAPRQAQVFRTRACLLHTG